jgi:mannose-6-phosphate isomerase-like protein (cupin superfamily)
MLSILRGAEPVRRNTASQNPVYYENNTSSQQFHPTGSKYFTTHRIPSKKSMFNPPLHLHLYQTELFTVRSGKGIWHLPTHADPAKRKTTLTAGQDIWLPAGIFHRFENPSEDEELVVDIRIEPPTAPWGIEERFFRNFFGYLEDCTRSGVSPSIFQLELFLHTVDGPIAIPVPGPDSLKWWASRIFCLILGVVIGEWLLGYKRSYPEYYVGDADNAKDK